MHLCRMSNSVHETIELPSPQDDPGRFIDVLERRCREYRIDLVVPVSEETPYIADLLDRELPVFSSHAADVLTLHDKLGFILKAREFGLDAPETARADEDTTALRASAFVTKPRFSCSGRGVRFHDAETHVAMDADRVVQQRVNGDAVNVFCIAIDGRVRLSTAYRGRLVDGSVAIAFERDDQANSCTAWAERFISASGYTGLIAFDFIVDADGRAWPLECNPRATSGIHYATPDALVAAITGEAMPPETLKTATRLAEKWSCFTHYLGSLGSPERTRRAWRVLSSFTDISWRRNDPWPFLAMPVNSWRLLLKSLQKDQSFASAAVADIEWRQPAGTADEVKHDTR